MTELSKSVLELQKSAAWVAYNLILNSGFHEDVFTEIERICSAMNSQVRQARYHHEDVQRRREKEAKKA